MYNSSDFDKPFYKTGEIAKLVGLHVRTIQLYCDTGRIKCIRSDSGLRLIPKTECLKFLESFNLINHNNVAIYTKSDPRDLLTGKTGVLMYVDEDGSKLQELLKDILADKLDKLILKSRNELSPFVETIETLCKEHNIEIEYKENARG